MTKTFVVAATHDEYITTVTDQTLDAGSTFWAESLERAADAYRRLCGEHYLAEKAGTP